MHLVNGSRVAIIGGGPAGSFFALWALQLAAQRGLRLDITIFERKDFAVPGPAGCNMCAGVLSSRTMHALPALGLNLPATVVMARVRAYVAHWGKQSVTILPPDPASEIVTISRGGGPLKHPLQPAASFDAFLLDEAVARGAKVVREHVKTISFGEKPKLQTSAGADTFDLIVLATGVNAPAIELRGLDYAPPQTETMIQDEILLNQPAHREQMNASVHVYFDEPSGLIFGGLVPKGSFANVSLLGHGLGRDSTAKFLQASNVAAVVGTQPQRLCGCRPRAVVSPARGYFGDRFVAVGDACVTRLYKDGIGSAFVTARAAAEAALGHGIGHDDFRTHYAPACRAIARDNRFGRAVFGLVAWTKAHDYLVRVWGRALAAEQMRTPNARPLSRVLWELFTGDASYQEILRKMFSARCMLRVGQAMLQELRETR